MRIRVLQTLPGSIGGLPAGEHFQAGQEYDVADHLAATMKREGWAVDATPEPVADEPAAEPAQEPRKPRR